MGIEFSEDEVASADHSEKTYERRETSDPVIKAEQEHIKMRFSQWISQIWDSRIARIIQSLGAVAIIVIFIYVVIQPNSKKNLAKAIDGSGSQSTMIPEKKSDDQYKFEQFSQHIWGKLSDIDKNLILRAYRLGAHKIMLLPNVSDAEITESKISEAFREKLSQAIRMAYAAIKNAKKTTKRSNENGLLDIDDPEKKTISYYYEKANEETDPTRRKALFEVVHDWLVAINLTNTAIHLLRDHAQELVKKQVFPKPVLLTFVPSISKITQNNIEFILNNRNQDKGKYFWYSMEIIGVNKDGKEQRYKNSDYFSDVPESTKPMAKITLPFERPLAPGFSVKKIILTTTPRASSHKIIHDWLIIDQFAKPLSLSKKVQMKLTNHE